jgi:peroxiredoxin
MTSTSASLADQGAAVRATAANRLPPDVSAAFDAALAELTAIDIPGDAAQSGTLLSDATLLDAQGNPTTLHASIGHRPAVLVFYRGAWCPYCNLTLNTYRHQLYPRLQERAVGMVAISPQTPDGSLTMQEKHGLTFPVLSDPGNELARELNILMPTRSERLRAAQQKLGLELETINADGTANLPLPTVVFLDAEHRVAWLDVRPDYTARTEVADILDAIDTTLRRSGG